MHPSDQPVARTRCFPDSVDKQLPVRHIPGVFCVGYLSDVCRMGRFTFNKFYITVLCTQAIGPVETLVSRAYTSRIHPPDKVPANHNR